MERYELICFSLRPGLTPEQARTLTASVLPGAPEPRPGVRLGVLAPEAARAAQRRLTRAGVICNYRPATATPDWQLAPEEQRHVCGGCGRPAHIPAGRRNYRCRHCRRPILRHGREVPPPAETAPPPPASPRSRAPSLLLAVAAVILLGGGDPARALAAKIRDSAYRQLAPLAGEFQFLTQVMARQRLQPHPAPALPAVAAAPVDHTAAPTAEKPATVRAAAAPAESATPDHPLLPEGEGRSEEENREPLPTLPEPVRQARSLTQLETALRRQIDAAPARALPRLPETPSLPPVKLPLLPQPVAVDPARLRAVVAELDGHLRRKAPFLRTLYRHDLELLDQLQRLERSFQAPQASAPSYAVPQSEARTRATAVPAFDAPGYCPVVPLPAACPAA
ncbi:hypothetical protein MIT9_P2332 [Methylomarinovum caldicuralii]|uniref:Uncharacterized protein n=2 Tax=Methylomarinovum caldicuralii TaxID=438856 RepID=A0AAU9CAU2_9GAMM|nr:hypothetical protein MIT9_P2332 [Methylomarinovum caldicuralii]